MATGSACASGFSRSGLAGFGEHEVVELLPTLAIPHFDVKPPAKELVSR